MSGNSLRALIVGAGPSGLTMAHELVRRGIEVRIVDAAQGPADTSRALATHARTLEIYDQMGILPELLPQGRRIQKFTLHQSGRKLAALKADYSELPTRFPMTVMVDQAITEKVLRDAVAAFGGKVEWGVRLESLEQDAGGVTVRLRHSGDRVETVRTDWLVGCDGGHSVVRKQLGLNLVGDSSETWLIADAHLDAGLDDTSLHWLRNRDGALMAVPFPEPGKWRLLDTADATYDGDAQQIGERFARKLSQAVGRPVTVRTPTWVSVFTIQQRMITRMRSGRCFVAGDAAHVHSPASGQGMNTGIQDAYNLAWKLASVIHGHAGQELLDTYGAERVPVGARLLGSTNRATQLIQLKSPVAALILPVMFKVVSTLPPLRAKISRKIMRAMSALDLSYADSPLTRGAGEEQADGPVPGVRLSQLVAAEEAEPGFAALLEELRDPRWTLLARATGPADPHPERLLRLTDAHADWLSVRTVVPPGTDAPHALHDSGPLTERLSLRAPGDWLLARPDGYVAARGRDTGTLTEALAAATAGAPGGPPGPQGISWP
ncbi:FAD-dependent monooxygenase [Streptomyces graminilatus]|uniref:FAD-dependent monooxygenase n=1 Tax=Streptomyces graminilatus TaxID=1464070 RepID=UPI000A83A9FF|nr:FAD-dependent monooxygenase [Streptomyces graminilatus]